MGRVVGGLIAVHYRLVTALGGLLGGIVGLILAVIAADAIGRLRSKGFIDEVADRAEPTVRRVLG
jgi:putative heme transporter